jgi:hypothetical protein
MIKFSWQIEWFGHDLFDQCSFICMCQKNLICSIPWHYCIKSWLYKDHISYRILKKKKKSFSVFMPTCYFCISTHGGIWPYVEFYCHLESGGQSIAFLECSLLVKFNALGWGKFPDNMETGLFFLLPSLFLMTPATVGLLLCQLVWHLFYKE